MKSTLKKLYKEVIEKRTPLKTFNVKGKSGDYEVSLWRDGKISCNCPASCFSKQICRHRRELETELISKFGCIAEALNHYKNNK